MLKQIRVELLDQFKDYLKNEERESSTIAKYLHDIKAFADWLQDREVTKENLTAYKEYLIRKKYNPKTVNGILSAINKFLVFAGMEELKVKYLRIQRQLFRNSNRELTQAEYLKLLNKAQELGKERLSLLMQTICATGIRVSELKYITIETVKKGRVRYGIQERKNIWKAQSESIAKMECYQSQRTDNEKETETVRTAQREKPVSRTSKRAGADIGNWYGR